jgi:hypothetical protein
MDVTHRDEKKGGDEPQTKTVPYWPPSSFRARVPKGTDRPDDGGRKMIYLY